MLEFQRLYWHVASSCTGGRAQGRGHASLHLCAGRRAPDPLALSGAPPAGKRRQFSVHQLTDEAVLPEAIARDPLEIVETQGSAANPNIAKPLAIFGADRRNAKGWDTTDVVTS